MIVEHSFLKKHFSRVIVDGFEDVIIYKNKIILYAYYFNVEELNDPNTDIIKTYDKNLIKKIYNYAHKSKKR